VSTPTKSSHLAAAGSAGLSNLIFALCVLFACGSLSAQKFMAAATGTYADTDMARGRSRIHLAAAISTYYSKRLYPAVDAADYYIALKKAGVPVEIWLQAIGITQQ
jgi:hypothetical protein